MTKKYHKRKKETEKYIKPVKQLTSYNSIPSIKEKIAEYESTDPQTFAEKYGFSKELYNQPDITAFSYYFLLFHGIRFQQLEVLEAIFQDKEIRCGNKIRTRIESYDGTTKSIWVGNYKEENCNLGEYVSVIPYDDEWNIDGIITPTFQTYEFNDFVRSHIFLIIKGHIDAIETFFLPWEEYHELKKSGIKHKNLYSYAHEEFLVKDHISLEDVLAIGIDKQYYIDGDIDETISRIIKLMKEYEISIPLIDMSSNKVLFQLDDDLTIRRSGL